MNWDWLRNLVGQSSSREPADPLGPRGENAAAKHLRALGYKILVRNYRCKSGEIDIVARDGKTLVFVEVKTRVSGEWLPEDAVDSNKQRQITRCAEVYLTRFPNVQPTARFDIVAIVWPKNHAPTIRHHLDAFPPRSDEPVIDTHCHLTDARLASQLEAVLDRAAAVGVTRVITIGCDPDDGRAALAICRRHPTRVRCAIGIHPNHCGEVDVDAIDAVRSLLTDEHVVALGEIGLDYFRTNAPRDRQRAFFEAQLRVAVELDKPVVLHAREAIDDTLAILASFAGVRAVFHSFTGTPDEARRIADRGYTIGFTGPVTYKKNDALREAARLVPLDQLVVETDGPYLSPEPVRSQRVNEPAFVVHVARAIADARGIAFDAFDEATTANAKRFFGW